MKKDMFRKLETMPYDHTFNVDGNEELCHATGREVCFAGDDPGIPGNWWNEYKDRNGCLHYGR